MLRRVSTGSYSLSWGSQGGLKCAGKLTISGGIDPAAGGVGLWSVWAQAESHAGECELAHLGEKGAPCGGPPSKAVVFKTMDRKHLVGDTPKQSFFHF